MATHASENLAQADDRTQFGGGSKLLGAGAVLAVLGIGGALGLGFSGQFTLRPFLFGYLAAYMFVLALALGSLAFVLLQHLTRAAWSVSVRRTAENFAATLPVLAVLALPMIASVAAGNGFLYRWALPIGKAIPGAMERAAKGEAEMETGPAAEIKPANPATLVPTNADEEMREGYSKFAAPADPTTVRLDPLTLMKRSFGLHWLAPWFFIFRIIFYVVLWSGIAIWFRRTSITQDRNGDERLSLRMQAASAPCLVLLGLTITGAAFDLLMSLDPHWYSTMFGVFYIADCFVGSYALLIITHFVLQRFGYLGTSVTTEHYHDLGKYLFAFTFFYGYIAFAQYMLIWYSNIPEETGWFVRHGASTFYQNGWNHLMVAILLGHFLIPFAGLMSRHPKRRPGVLVLWAVWQLVFVAIDMYWVVTPERGLTAPDPSSILITLAGMVGVAGAFFAAFGFLSSRASLRAMHDPRLSASLAFQNA